MTQAPRVPILVAAMKIFISTSTALVKAMLVCLGSHVNSGEIEFKNMSSGYIFK